MKVRRAWRRGGPRLVALSTFAALLFWSPAFVRPYATGFGDWQYFHHMWEVAAVAMRRFGEIALLDPHQCGGVPLWGDPQAQTFGPWFLLSFLVGTTLALKLGVVAHAAIGFYGTFRYATEEQRLAPLPATLASIVFTWTGFFAWHVAGGHSAFLPFAFAPLLALSVRRAHREPRSLVLAAALLALTLYEGGVYPLPYMVLVVGFESILDRSWREIPRALVVALAIGVLACLLGSARLLAVAVELGRHPRPTQTDDHLTAAEVFEFLTVRDHDWRVPGHPYVWPEYCAYVGIPVLILASVGLLVALRRGRVRVVLGTVVFGLMMMGDLGEFSPWALLHRVPVFDSLRVPSRFAVFFLAQLGLCAAFAIDALRPRGRRLSLVGRAFAVVVVAVVALDLFVVTRPIVDRWKEPPIPALAEGAPRFVQESPSTFGASFAAYPSIGHGGLGCYVVLDYRPSYALRVGDVPQAWIADGDGRVRVSARTTNTLTLDVDARSSVLVETNQNFLPDFRSDLGRLEDSRGLLAVRIPRGRHRVVLAFRPETIRCAVAPTLLGLGLAAAGLRRRRESRADTLSA